MTRHIAECHQSTRKIDNDERTRKQNRLCFGRPEKAGWVFVKKREVVWTK